MGMSDATRGTMNKAARKAIGNSGKTDRAGNLLGTTRGEKDNGQRILDELVKSGDITQRQADQAKDDAVSQAGGKSGLIARRFGR